MLPYDYSRCLGHDCLIRDTCDRYLSLADMGNRTPQAQFEPKDCDQYIPVREVKG